MTASKSRRENCVGSNSPARPSSVARWLALAVACLAMICSIPARAQYGQPPAGGSLHHYGILGQVGQPDTYSSTNPRLTLSELVAAAGGVTKDAARLAKVIRNGRAGFQFSYSPQSVDQLMPGDVVVFDHMASVHGLTPGNSPSETVGVAFVGLDPNRPVVVSLPQSFATLPELVRILNQHPSLINTLNVIRTSPSAPRLAPGQLPTTLHDGDVIVFRPETINQQELANARAFPPAIPVMTAHQPQPTPGESPVLAFVEDAEPTSTLPSLAHPPLASQYAPPSLPEPARGFEEQTLPPLAFPSATQFVTTTGMIDEPAVSQESSSAPQPTMDAGVYAADPEEFATDSFTRLAMASPTAEESFSRAESAGGTVRTAVPTPFDLPLAGPATRRGSRTTTLGITVLVIAVICFAASLLWSRLDDAAGVVRDETHNVLETSPRPSATQQRGALDQLIDNALPLIEEQTSLPERAEYHGQAVGRRRIRIDARHALTGPHFDRSSKTAPPQETVAASAPTTGEKQFRVDTPSASPTTSAGPADAETIHRGRSATSKSTGKPSGGLLDRILVAIEREKRT